MNTTKDSRNTAHAVTLSVVDRMVVVVILTVTVIVTVLLMELTCTKTVTVQIEWTVSRTQGIQTMLSYCQ